MAIMIVIDLDGDSKDLLQRYNQAAPAFEEKARSLAEAKGFSTAVHSCTVTEFGIRIAETIDGDGISLDAGTINSMSTGQMLEWMESKGLVDSVSRKATKDAGLTDVPYRMMVHEVHNFTVVQS